ncbi:hypothetical protein FEM48_Zijuj12G0079600 [Ziziphus jujuba var. spinosa]|uniref:Uncharacterized protein n=1 Tax=Ziziphus jujuba var. spinosa TaxID=714518 RepID=A0A978UC40_ZIZJJ|nr:hypothetical protein FEM48_Zijuj12G0079600 [Ziziphus jujuba var. spinosa]
MLPRCEKVHITMKRLVNLLYGIGLRLLNVGEARETNLEGMPSTEASRTMNQILYIGQKNEGIFQHSSFLAGEATLSAGILVVEHGVQR